MSQIINDEMIRHSRFIGNHFRSLSQVALQTISRLLDYRCVVESFLSIRSDSESPARKKTPLFISAVSQARGHVSDLLNISIVREDIGRLHEKGGEQERWKPSRRRGPSARRMRCFKYKDVFLEFVTFQSSRSDQWAKLDISSWRSLENSGGYLNLNRILIAIRSFPSWCFGRHRYG